MLAGLVIDAIDLATFGPIGLYSGMLIGGAVGYLMAPELGFPARGRWACALMTGVYCTLPLTGFIPAAAIGAGIAHSLLGDEERPEEGDGLEPGQPPAIEVEYESEWEDARGDDLPPRDRG